MKHIMNAAVLLAMFLNSNNASSQNNSDVMSMYKTIQSANDKDPTAARYAVNEAARKCIGEIKSEKAREVSYKIFTDTVDVVSLGLPREKTYQILRDRLTEALGGSADELEDSIFKEIIFFINSMNKDSTKMMCLITETSSRL